MLLFYDVLLRER